MYFRRFVWGNPAIMEGARISTSVMTAKLLYGSLKWIMKTNFVKKKLKTQFIKCLLCLKRRQAWLTKLNYVILMMMEIYFLSLFKSSLRLFIHNNFPVECRCEETKMKKFERRTNWNVISHILPPRRPCRARILCSLTTSVSYKLKIHKNSQAINFS